MTIPFRFVRWSDFDSSPTEHVGHGIVSGLLAMRPQRRLQRAMGEHHAILSLDASASMRSIGPGKDHAVIAGRRCRRAATRSRYRPACGAPVMPSRPRAEWSSSADAAAGGGGLAQHEGGARRVRRSWPCGASRRSRCRKLSSSDLRDTLDQSGEQIDAEAHIAGLHDHRALSVTLLITAIVGGRKSGGADDMNEAALGGDRDIGDGPPPAR